jgi:hypothetical protein
VEVCALSALCALWVEVCALSALCAISPRGWAAKTWFRSLDRNSGTLLSDAGVSGSRFSAAPTALGSSSGLIPSPSGLGSRLAAGPPGLASLAILQCHFFLHLPQASGLPGMTKGRVGSSFDICCTDPTAQRRDPTASRGCLGDPSVIADAVSPGYDCSAYAGSASDPWLPPAGR